MEPFKIFIVEDDPWYGEILEYHLSLNEDYIINRFTTGKECLANLHKKPDLITIDFSLPDFTGDKLYQRIKEIDDSIPVLAISGQEEIAVGQYVAGQHLFALGAIVEGGLVLPIDLLNACRIAAIGENDFAFAGHAETNRD